MLKETEINQELIEQAGCQQCCYYQCAQDSESSSDCAIYPNYPPGESCPDWKPREHHHTQYLPEKQSFFLELKDIINCLNYIAVAMILFSVSLLFYYLIYSALPEVVLPFLSKFIVAGEVITCAWAVLQGISIWSFSSGRDNSYSLMMYTLLIIFLQILTGLTS